MGGDQEKKRTGCSRPHNIATSCNVAKVARIMSRSFHGKSYEGEGQKRAQTLSLGRYAIVPPEVFCEAKDVPN